MSLRPITPEVTADICRFLIFCRIVENITINRCVHCAGHPQQVRTRSTHLKLGVTAEDHLGSLLGLVEEGGVGHRHPRHLVVLPRPGSHLAPVGHPHLLGKRLDVRHRSSIHLELLGVTCVINKSLS